MKTIKAIFVYIFLCLSQNGNSQNDLSSVLELNINFGLSNDLAEVREGYLPSDAMSIIVINKRWFARLNYFSFGYTKLINPKNGIKASFGLTKYGFDYDDIQITKNSTYRINYMELGISYVYRTPTFSTAKLVLEPGFRYHWNATSPVLNAISFRHIDSFSFSSYAGFEVPMLANNFFISAGLQVKVPLHRYNTEFSVTNDGYYPYFIGIRIGVNYQF